jgi:glycosyltransferase involved in cell wall biosynthesis
MKILLAAGLYPPDIGGPATYASMLAGELPKQGIAVVVLPYGTVRHVPKVFRHLVYTYRLWQQSQGANRIYALDPISVGVPARLVAFLRRVPLLVRLGGDYAWEQGVQRFGVRGTLDEYSRSEYRRPWLVNILAAIQTWVVRGAETVVVPSAYLKSIVATWGITPEKIVVLYSAVEPITVAAPRAELREDFNFIEPTIVSVGRLTPWKGFRTVIDVIALRTVRGEKTTLVIAGSGPEELALKAYAEAKGVSDKVRFVGALTQDALFAVIKAADVFVLNTAYEGLSHQLLEVMTIGTPIVTTPVGGNPELITDGVEGRLVAVNDTQAFDVAITEMLQNETLRETYTRNAQKRVEAFSAETAIVNITKFLRSVL